MPAKKTISEHNVGLPAVEVKLPEIDERLTNTIQLASCLGLLKTFRSTDDMLQPAARNWLQAIEKDLDEQDRLKVLATDVIRAFKRDEFKDAKAVAEVVYLAPVFEKDDFQYLLRELCLGVNQSILLESYWTFINTKDSRN
ncbi:hypothetical protein BGZ65_000954 [Modicella reniformis]|uniref:Uncharacterized protein n=1 Tax=Modicella reniformis TaxID=1440133 RepID=A0A9P6MA10_9FUNG|nr:hypothetical protein BGZ65_000954 [Modicella reniformis]